MSVQQPAQMTALGTQGFSLLPSGWTPNRGLVLRSSLPALPQDAAPILSNMRWNGVCWTTQNIGWTTQRPGAFNGGAQFLEMGIHCLTNGSTQFIQQVGNQVQLYNPLLLTPETVLFTAGSTTAIPCMTSYSPNFFLYVNGVDLPQVWNGTTWGALGGFPIVPPGGSSLGTPNLVESFNNRGVYAGFTNNAFAVAISDFGNPGSFTLVNPGNNPTFGGIYFVPSKLGPITSLKVARMNQTSNQQVLLIGCQNGFAFVAGLDFTSFTMVAASSGRWGMLSNRTWFQLDDNLFALCTDGIRPFNTNTTYSNLISGCLSLPVHPIITNQNPSAGASAFVLDNPAELEATFYFPSGSQVQNTTALIMSYADMGNGLVRFSQKVFPPAVSGQPPTYPACAARYGGLYWAGGYDGLLQQLYNGNKWNTVPISYQIQSPLFQPPTVAEEASVRGFWILTQGDTMTMTASSTAWAAHGGQAPGINPTTTLTQQLTVNNDGATILGTWILSQSAFGGPRYNISPFYPPGAGRAWQVSLSGSTANGDISFLGIFSALIAGGTRQ